MPEDECFTLTHFIARAPYRTEVPLKAGYVWVTNDEPNVGAYADEFTELPGCCARRWQWFGHVIP